MKDMANSMKKTTSQSDKVSYVDSGASSHMTSHEEWFSYLDKLEQPGVVETRDDSNMSEKFPSTIPHVIRQMHHESG